jgi:hypothetical protein
MSDVRCVGMRNGMNVSMWLHSRTHTLDTLVAGIGLHSAAVVATANRQSREVLHCCKLHTACRGGVQSQERERGENQRFAAPSGRPVRAQLESDPELLRHAPQRVFLSLERTAKPCNTLVRRETLEQLNLQRLDAA